MGDELEVDVAAGLAAGGFVRWRRKHALPIGTPCYNCRTPLKGPWCYACGQVGEDFHRSSRLLIWEFLENVFDADSRLWRTLPRLVRWPADLTRDYLAGRRAPQLPPLRLFLVVLLLVFVVGEISGIGDVSMPVIHHDPGDDARLQELRVNIYAPWDAALTEWTKAHVGRALAHPDRFVAAMGAWAHDFAFLTLPVSALVLSLIFIFRRGYLLFDHLIFSMHSLAFQGLLCVTCMCLQAVGLEGAWWLLLASPVHLFVHMRGVYGTGRFGTLLRMLVLFIASLIAFVIVMLGLVLVGLAELKA